MKKEAQLFKSLADETRLKMLWLLMGLEELCVCDIMGVLGITQSKASRHLRHLYHLGWVTDRREGVWMNYRPVSYTHLRAHETGRNLVCRLLLEKKNKAAPFFRVSSRSITTTTMMPRPPPST